MTLFDEFNDGLFVTCQYLTFNEKVLLSRISNKFNLLDKKYWNNLHLTNHNPIHSMLFNKWTDKMKIYLTNINNITINQLTNITDINTYQQILTLCKPEIVCLRDINNNTEFVVLINENVVCLTVHIEDTFSRPKFDCWCKLEQDMLTCSDEEKEEEWTRINDDCENNKVLFDQGFENQCINRLNLCMLFFESHHFPKLKTLNIVYNTHNTIFADYEYTLKNMLNFPILESKNMRISCPIQPSKCFTAEIATPDDKIKYCNIL